MMVVDVDSGSIAAVNRATERLTGFSQHELSGRPLWEVIVSPAGRAGLHEAFSAPSGAGIPLAFEALLKTKSRDARRVVWSGAFITDGFGIRTHVVMTGIDVATDFASAGLFNHLMRAATTRALVGADLEGRITFFSSGAETMLGRPAQEMIGRTIPAETFEFSEFLALTSDQGERSLTRDWSMVRKDGTRFMASVTVSPVTDGAGQRIGYLGVAVDVTEQRRTQDLLLEALEKEQAAVERLAALDRAKDAFISTANHELRTPLTSISGYSELLNDGAAGELTLPQEQLVEAILRNTERLTALVDELLTLSSLEISPPAAPGVGTDLRDVITDAKRDLEVAIAPRGPRVQFDLTEHPVVVDGDRSHLRSVVWHLLSNALKCTGEADDVTCLLRTDEGEAFLEISDTGFGISEDEQPQLFDKFFRSAISLDRAVQGSGLGLAIVHRAVERLGGEISVISAHLAGATFTVRLPLRPHEVS